MFPVTFPVRFAVIVPAVKFPLASRATIVDGVLSLVAVVAELLTLPVVAIVANLLSAMAAVKLMSALTISPSFIFPEVTASVASMLVTTLSVPIDATPAFVIDTSPVTVTSVA